jgi:hypothetical protein
MRDYGSTYGVLMKRTLVPSDIVAGFIKFLVILLLIVSGALIVTDESEINTLNTNESSPTSSTFGWAIIILGVIWFLYKFYKFARY